MGERHNWWHLLLVIVPENLRADYESHGYIWVAGKTNDRMSTGVPGMPDQDDSKIIEGSAIATGIGIPVGVLHHVSSFI